jgi:MFS family permease
VIEVHHIRIEQEVQGAYCLTVRNYLRSLNPQLPRSVQTLQLGGLLNATGNGLILPFTLIYLHNERGIDLGTAGLVMGTNAAVSLVSGPIAGAFVDRVGGKRMLAIALLFLAVGIAGYSLVETAAHGFLAAAIVGIGNGAFWPSQSSLLSGLAPREKRPAVFAMQRVTMNLGIGIGGLAGGFIASESFEALFIIDAFTFVAYLAVLWVFVPEPRHAVERSTRSGSYRDVLRHRVFMGLMVVNAAFIVAGIAQLEVLPAYAKNEVGIAETGIGQLFFINTLAVVLLQLPIARFARGHRRMPFLALVGVFCAVSWLLVPVSGLWLAGAGAFAVLALAVAIFGIAECLHGAVQAPLVADLADHRLIGRYMAISAFSWQVGFTIGPAAGAALLAVSPTGLWIAAAIVCVLAGVAALALERGLPENVRRTPRIPTPARAPVAVVDVAFPGD